MYMQERKGSCASARENPYHTPATNETGIYADLKKLKIPNIPGLELE